MRYAASPPPGTRRDVAEHERPLEQQNKLFFAPSRTVTSKYVHLYFFSFPGRVAPTYRVFHCQWDSAVICLY